jgi:hypothetical protein
MVAMDDTQWAREAAGAMERAGFGAGNYELLPDRTIGLRGNWHTMMEGLAGRLEDLGLHVEVYLLQPGNRQVGYRLTLAAPGAARGVGTIPVASLDEVPAAYR